MKKKSLFACSLLLFLFSFGFLSAQEPQVPNIYLNNQTKLEGEGVVRIASRSDLLHGGTFYVETAGSCIPPAYPGGRVIVKIDMSDSSINYFESTTIEAMSSTGKHTPIAYIMGRCKTDNEEYEGCHFWIKIADNRSSSTDGTPDIVTFLVLDGNGKRLAYGSGPLVEGDIYISSTSN